MKKTLPHDVETALSERGYFAHSRNCPEKCFALACHRFGISDLKLSASYWVGEPPSIDGLVLAGNSIVSTEPAHRGDRPLLWRILDYLHIGFSGGAGTGWAQASWLTSDPRIQKEAHPYFRSLSLPLVVAYFNAIKPL